MKKKELNYAQRNMLNVICPSRYKINRKEIKQVVEEIFAKENIPEHYTANIIFAGKNKIKKLALKYKKENLALPVLSFPYNQKKDNLFGEIFICYPQAVLLAAQRDKKVNETINRLIEHGINNIIR